MKEILEKYNKLTDEEKNDLEDLYFLHQLQLQIKKAKQLGLTMLEEQILYNKGKECLRFCNISEKELISRLLEMLKCVDITVHDIDKLKVRELIELLSDNKGDFKNEPEILVALKYGKFYCVLLKDEKEYIFIYEKEDGTQYVDRYNIEDLFIFIIKKRLLERGEFIV